VVAHGQMSPAELDRVMTDFFSKKYDCLIATTIIENGLDLPNVNTIIINKADHFGLSQLYQLRGRVGRSTRDAYCYLMYTGKTLSSQLEEQNIADDKLKKAMYRKYVERLQAIVDNQDLGSGFRVASRDLEIRGAGSLLGEQQSGFISSIGYAMYIEMLATEVEKLKSL
jgi:transcription-repair coupling factor (superfamily II helicase)